MTPHIINENWIDLVSLESLLNSNTPIALDDETREKNSKVSHVFR